MFRSLFASRFFSGNKPKKMTPVPPLGRTVPEDEEDSTLLLFEDGEEIEENYLEYFSDEEEVEYWLKK